MNVRHLLERYDATLPARETHAFVRVTLHFPDAIDLNGVWEKAQAFAISYFVLERQLAVIMALTLRASPRPAHFCLPIY